MTDPLCHQAQRWPSQHNTTRQVAGEFQQKDVASLLSGLARDQDAVGIWSLPPVRPPPPCPSLGRRQSHSRDRAPHTGGPGAPPVVPGHRRGPVRRFHGTPFPFHRKAFFDRRPGAHRHVTPQQQQQHRRTQACRAFAVVGRDESLWRPLGHPSWEQHHARTYVIAHTPHPCVGIYFV